MTNKTLINESITTIKNAMKGENLIVTEKSELIIYGSLTLTGTLENYGKITIHGAVKSKIINQTNGILIVNGSISGEELTNQTDAHFIIGITGNITNEAVDNSGMIILEGVIDSSTCINQGSGIIKNNGNLTLATNLGTIINSGSLGTIDNHGTIS